MKFLFKRTYDDDIKLLKHAGYWRASGLMLGLAVFLPVLFLALGFGSSALSHPIEIITLATCAMGLMILTGYTGQISLGHGAFFLAGAYVFHFINRLSLDLGWEAPWYLALVLTPLILGLIGYLIARPTLRMNSVTLAIATLLLMILTEQALKQWTYMDGLNGFRTPKFLESGNWFHSLWTWLAGSFGLLEDMSTRDQRLFARDIPKYAIYYGSLVSLVFVIWLMNNLVRSNLGRTLIAIRDSEVSARSMGVNIEHYKSLAFALSAAIAGLAGVFFSYNKGFMDPTTINFVTSIILLLIVVVGGLGSIHGAIFGAIAYVVLRHMLFPELEELFHHWGAEGSWVYSLGSFFGNPEIGEIVFATLLLLILFAEPLGLYARWRKTEAYFQTFPFYRAGTFKRQRSYAKTERLK